MLVRSTDNLSETFGNSNCQTETVDTWSLGVTVLLLIGGPHKELNRLDQAALESHISSYLASSRPDLSSHGQNFILSCLRVEPSNRMTITEAACHDWLCTPESHLEFFQRFDERMMADWSLQKHVRPMTLELQSINDACKATSEYGEGGAAEMATDRTRSAEDKIDHASEYFAKVVAHDEKSRVRGAAKNQETGSGFIQAKEKSPYGSDLDAVPESPSSFANWTKPPLPSGDAPGLVRLRRDSKKRKKRQPSKIPDFLFLPLPGLGRHLPQPSDGIKREAVLEALTRTNSMFLNSANADFTMQSSEDVFPRCSKKVVRRYGRRRQTRLR